MKIPRPTALAALVSLVLAVPVSAQSLPPLFAPAPPPPGDVVQELSRPEVVRLAFGNPALDVLAGDAFLLNLFEDVSLVATRERVERRSRSSFTWHGRIAGNRESSVLLVVRDGRLTGSILNGTDVYDVVALDGDTRSAIREIDQAEFGPDEPPEDTGPAEPGDGAAGRRPAAILGPTCSEGDFIDVMVVYTEDAADSVGDILGEIQAGVDDANASYANSGIVQRLRLVHTAQVDYAESGDSPTDRDRLKDPSDGFMDEVHALRDTYGADLVSLWTATGNWCGFAYVMGTVDPTFEEFGFATVTASCAVNNHTFAHELGHVMGARHDRFVDGTDGSPFAYNHGFVNVGDGWRTIMAYNDACEDAGTSCTRLQYWSNPDVTYGGDPMGILDGEADAADNRSTLNGTRTTVQQFRGAHAPVADAGADLAAECGVATALDGSASCDPDADPLSYAWSGAFAEGGGNASGVAPALTFPKGIHPVTLVVSDGTIASVPDEVIVTAADTLEPQVVCPADLTVACDASTDPAATGSASATDLCDAAPGVGFSDFESPGACPQEKTIARTWTATDADGNDAACVQTITVDDAIGPTVTCQVEKDLLWPPNHKWTDVGFTFEAVDDCDADLDVAIAVTSDEHPSSITGAGGSHHCPDAEIDPVTHAVRLRNERSGGGDGRVYVIAVTVTDSCGNPGTCQATVLVPRSRGSSVVVDSGQDHDATTCGAPLVREARRRPQGRR